MKPKTIERCFYCGINALEWDSKSMMWICKNCAKENFHVKPPLPKARGGDLDAAVELTRKD